MQEVLTQVEPGQSVFQLQYWLTLGPEAQNLPHSTLELQTTLVASLVSRHGRPTSLVWLTVQKSALKGMRNEVEDAVVLRLREVIAPR